MKKSLILFGIVLGLSLFLSAISAVDCTNSTICSVVTVANNSNISTSIIYGSGVNADLFKSWLVVVLVVIIFLVSWYFFRPKK